MGFVADIGKRYARFRNEVGMLVADVSDLCGLNRSVIDHLESGFALPSYDNLSMLCDAVGITVSQLVPSRWLYKGKEIDSVPSVKVDFRLPEDVYSGLCSMADALGISNNILINSFIVRHLEFWERMGQYEQETRVA